MLLKNAHGCGMSKQTAFLLLSVICYVPNLCKNSFANKISSSRAKFTYIYVTPIEKILV